VKARDTKKLLWLMPDIFLIEFMRSGKEKHRTNQLCTVYDLTLITGLGL